MVDQLERDLDLSDWPASDPLLERTPAHLYLDLLKKALTRLIVPENRRPLGPRKGVRRLVYRPIKRLLNARGMDVVRRIPADPDARQNGRDLPAEAETMIGLKRLDNLEFCVADVVRRGVPGDLIETGVWRGGAAIFMRAALEAFGDTERVVWAADSFQGLPKPDPARTTDVEDALWSYPILTVPLEQVKANFARYGMLDERVRFLPGWFHETLPSAPIERLSILRLDGDMYESTMVALEALYPKVSTGGYVIVDDFAGIRGCYQAVEEFRARHGIHEPLHQVDWTCVFWRRGDRGNG
ncbi:MAG TPA: TylF/MycF/NovP-related O-methyltransferase [Actinomycetota bacterium]|nr:TylF/MycF/NovP-related O-methyltransferase [Actinomycetota bacterium]